MEASRSSRAATLLPVLAVLLAVAVGFTAGRVTDSVPDGRPGPVAGVPVAFPRSPEGARAAAMQFATARARAVFVSPDARRRLLTAVGTRRWAQAAAAQDERRDLSPIAEEQGATYLAAAIGAKVNRYDGTRAIVVAWLVQTLGGGSGYPAGSWQTQALELVWSGDRWRVDRQRVARDQAVPMIDQTTRAGAYIRVVTGMRPPTYGTP